MKRIFHLALALFVFTLLDFSFARADSDSDGVPDPVDLCENTIIPESVPTIRLGVNRFAFTDGDTVFDTILSKHPEMTRAQWFHRRTVSVSTGHQIGKSRI